jgi:hypothetical protein
MRRFLSENWLYIVAPLALVVIGLVVLIVLDRDSSSPFVYPIF